MSLMTVSRKGMVPWNGLGEWDSHFRRFFGELGDAATSTNVANWAPAVDLRETDDAYVLEADLPGVDEDDIALTVEDDVVVLSGERHREEETEEKGYHRFERSHGSFRRSFRIAGGIDGDKVTAEFKNGVLKATLPKPEEAKPRRIKVAFKN